jgi:nucleoside phosphorylase
MASEKLACKPCTVNITGLNILPAQPVQTNKVQATTLTLPPADYLVVTWTEAETSSMAKVLGGGQYFFSAMTESGNNFIPLCIDTTTLPLPVGVGELSASDVQCHAFYFTTKVGGKSIICLKSNFHPKKEFTAGKFGVPMQNFFKWLVANNNFKFILTTGTSGGIWPNMDVGDVAVCNTARYDPNEVQLINTGKPKTIFTSAVGNLPGTLTGGKNQFDILTANINAYASCAISTMAAQRKPANGSIPKIFYQPLSGTGPNTVISDINFDMEKTNVDNNNYKTMGAVFDNNDAFVAEACENAGYHNWVSIRNISDLPGVGSDATYDKYQDCSSIIGALAACAFIVGH